MPTRDSNITLNLTDDDSPSVHRQTDDEPPDHQPSEEAAPPEYATPPDPPGTVTTENVPESPLAAQINQLTKQIDHPDEFTATELRAIAVGQLHPDLTITEIADRLESLCPCGFDSICKS